MIEQERRDRELALRLANVSEDGLNNINFGTVQLLCAKWVAAESFFLNLLRATLQKYNLILLQQRCTRLLHR